MMKRTAGGAHNSTVGACEQVAVVALHRCQAFPSAPLAAAKVALPYHSVGIFEPLRGGTGLQGEDKLIRKLIY